MIRLLTLFLFSSGILGAHAYLESLIGRSFDDPPRVNCLDGTQCPKDHKCFRVLGSPLGVCVPKESPPDSDPARNCVKTEQCKDTERCYRPAGTPIGVCVPKDSKRMLFDHRCYSDSDCRVGRRCQRVPGPRGGFCVFNDLLSHGFFDEKSCLVDSQCPAHQICSKPRPSTSGKCVPQGLPPGNRMLLDDKCTVNSECNAGEKCLRLPGNVRGICVPADKFRRFQPDDHCEEWFC